MGSKPARQRAGLLFFSGLVLSLIILGGESAFAGKRPPGYRTVHRVLLEIWKERYPLPIKKIHPNPRGRGVLRVTWKGATVYYYQFLLEIPRLRKKPNGPPGGDEIRRVELWVRYRPREKEPYDLTFAREDLLPGSNRQWLKYIK